MLEYEVAMLLSFRKPKDERGCGVRKTFCAFPFADRHTTGGGLKVGILGSFWLDGVRTARRTPLTRPWRPLIFILMYVSAGPGV